MIFIIVLIFTILFLIPLPIMFTLKVIDNEARLYIFRNVLLTKKISLESQNTHHENKEKKKSPNYYLSGFKILKGRYFKPILRYDLKIDYDLPDPYYAAITKGMLDSLFHFSNNFLRILFKVSRFNIEITPKFKNSLYLYFSLKGIIYINLVKITIIGYKLLKNRKKEVYPLRDTYEQ